MQWENADESVIGLPDPPRGSVNFETPTPILASQRGNERHGERKKAATRLLQELAASRRQLPMVPVLNPTRFQFDTNEGVKTLVDLFEGRKQLIMYHFMLAPQDTQACVGCSFCMDHIPDLGHLNSRDTSFVAVATAPWEKVAAYGSRMGWTFPFYSSARTHQAWAEAEQKGETITWKPGNGYFGLCVFLKEGNKVFHTYDTTDRGMEAILSTYHLLDMTPLGRQEVGNGMGNFRRHDEY
ncbi:hypothetical protein NUU61_001096 [Penicillium alfredii]|uniref:DUF899 domain-containing protein n=1 Tax=Penicillium alfredii TaxID=1506179 RepID=A0A9W9KRJ2_9EURO|nr:uncharacterized protein NUU61_001096 [Penicillium alfredii]KAJ5115337.1 hypothetical protein NUU61_001096 [Penicillium alfredii]